MCGHNVHPHHEDRAGPRELAGRNDAVADFVMSMTVALGEDDALSPSGCDDHHAGHVSC